MLMVLALLYRITPHKKITFASVVPGTVFALICFMALSASAVIYKPDSDGLYTVELEMSPGNDYIMFVLKGTYDQTNYIEAYNAAKDSDILYFEQKSSDENGKVTFGPFVPMGYYDATVIVGGTNLDELYLAGNLSAKGKLKSELLYRLIEELLKTRK